MEQTLRAALCQGNAPTAPLSERDAAVAILLCGAGRHVVLIRRAESDADPWSGQMALPGGRKEAQDPDLLHTAVRETKEEIGVALDETWCVGHLPRQRAHTREGLTNLWVTGFVFLLPSIPKTVIDKDEVAETLSIPFSEFENPANLSEFTFIKDGIELTFPAWKLENRIIWGLTHRTLKLLLNRLRGEFSTHSSPSPAS